MSREWMRHYKRRVEGEAARRMATTAALREVSPRRDEELAFREACEPLWGEIALHLSGVAALEELYAAPSATSAQGDHRG